MKPPNSDSGKDEQQQPRLLSGQMLLLATLSLFFIFGVVGLAVDMGYAFYVKQQVQAAADAAATAAANYALKAGHYTCGSNGVVCNASYSCPSPVGTVSTALQAGCAYASSNGFLNTGQQTVSMIANNTSINGTSPQYWVQSTVTQTINNLFGIPGGFSSQVIRAQSTAELATTQPAGGASCIYALGSTGVTFTDSGSGNITTSSCGIQVNGGFSYSASGNIHTTIINADGNISASGSGNITATSKILYNGTYHNTGSGNVSPAPQSGAGPVTDPLASLPAPSVGSCDHINYSYSSSSNTTVSPGVYCGGMSLTMSGNVTFQSGTYIMQGGGFTYSGSGNISGSAITIYNTGNVSYSIQPVRVTGSGNMNFSAPTSGTYQGILFYGDRTQTYGTANSFTASGNISSGTFYFPGTNINYSGSGNALYQALIANAITFTGSGNLSNDSSGTYTGLIKTTSSLTQ
jgi:hypothetical protein